MRTTIAIALAGAAGVLSRHGMQHLIPRHGDFPWGTLVVNVCGALLVGAIFTLVARRFPLPMWIQEAILVGFLGGFTTFSALSLETYLMVEHRRFVLAAVYALGSVLAGVAAVFVGIHFGRAAS
jgi:CrcB protein